MKRQNSKSSQLSATPQAGQQIQQENIQYVDIIILCLCAMF